MLLDHPLVSLLLELLLVALLHLSFDVLLVLDHCRSLFRDTVLGKNINARLHFILLLTLATLTPLFHHLVLISRLFLH